MRAKMKKSVKRFFSKVKTFFKNVNLGPIFHVFLFDTV